METGTKDVDNIPKVAMLKLLNIAMLDLVQHVSMCTKRQLH